MIRHKSLLLSMMMMWGALQAIIWFLMIAMMDHSPSKVMDVLFIFGTASAIITVWAYDFALKEHRDCKDNRRKHEHVEQKNSS